MVKEEVIKIHSLLLNNRFQFHRFVNKNVNEMDILQDVTCFIKRKQSVINKVVYQKIRTLFVELVGNVRQIVEQDHLI
jgi:hypothetical protein